MDITSFGQELLQLFAQELEMAVNFYPDDDSQNAGYREGVQACIDILQDLLCKKS